MAKSILRRFTKRFLIFVNILAAVFFLAGSYGYLLNPAYFWPVGLLTLTAFYFMLLLLGFVFFWLVIKPRLAFISVVALLLAYKPVSNIIAMRLPGPFAQAKPQNAIRVITWNVAQFNVMEDKKTGGKKRYG
ncbi:MAG: hypothetical protein IPG38_00485 [Chitinophagaceae bacterium]|nr:hypothetical protein [Chitinophagaceae bacterium]